MVESRNKRIMKKFLNLLLVLAAFLTLCGNEAKALPWDVDMYSQQSYKYTEMARAPVEGTIPLGYTPFTMTIDEADTGLKNPVSMSDDSLWRGKRLWSAQCSSCHGLDAQSTTFIGKKMGSPNLTDERFHAYSDGRIYATIVLGLRSMPRYGYKLSEAERWDIVNYLKHLQGRKN